MLESELSNLVNQFSLQVVALIESVTRARIQEAVAGIFDTTKRGPGRPRKNALLERPVALAISPRKKPPKQLCPVPGCKNPAAPVYGMVCAEHKNVPKAKIKEYRAARKAAKAAGKGGAKPAAKTRPVKAKRKAKRAGRAKAKMVRRPKPVAKTVTQPAASVEPKSE